MLCFKEDMLVYGEIKSLFEVYKRELTIRHYSPRTIKTYSSMLRRFVKYFHPVHPRAVLPSQIKEYLFSQTS